MKLVFDFPTSAVYFSVMTPKEQKSNDIHKENIRRFQAGDPIATKWLLDLNRSFVETRVLKYGRKFTGTDFDDLVQEGNLGLLEAYRRWDLTRDTYPFTYTSYYITAAIIKYLFKKARLVGIPSNSKSPKFRNVDNFTDMGTDTNYEYFDYQETLQSDEDLEDKYMELDFQERLRKVLPKVTRSISSRDRSILIQHFVEGSTLQSIADPLGISRERVRQISVEAITRIKNRTNVTPQDNYYSWSLRIAENL
jgi:RNA polymerase sigma factor (sigma-70 family)